MKEKRIPRPERLRRPPRQFSWLDHRLVRENRLSGCSAEALALYLFLATVADAEGLSYYGEAAITRQLGLDAAQLRAARACLIREELIAYQAPFYQVLSLDGGPASSRSEPASGRSGRALSLAEIHPEEDLRRAIEDATELEAFSCEYVLNLLQQRARPLTEKGVLHLTRGEDLLDLELPEPDLSIYEPESKHENK